MEFKINEAYQHLMPSLMKQDYGTLRESIARNGLLESIEVKPDGTILDGHNRYRVCVELGIKPHYRVRRFDNALLDQRFIFQANLARRHLIPYQKAELALPLLELERQIAIKRVGRRILAPSDFRHMPKSHGKATEIVAAKVGLSARTFERAVRVIECGSEDLKRKCRNGQTTINAAYVLLVQNSTSTPPLFPEGRFDVLYADPPWRYERPSEGSPEYHYPIMQIDEIKELGVPAARDACLFLWTTSPKLEAALQVMKSWGFAYRTCMIWDKGPPKLGYVWRQQHELLLFGKKGRFPAPPTKSRPASILRAPRGRHSEKPSEVYKMIESMYPSRSYLELFASRKREGWTPWGLDVGDLEGGDLDSTRDYGKSSA